jgi:cobalt-zinc-cadmium resistance protein CzcA
VQNDIILVAKINDFRKKGIQLRDAVIKGAMTKFRPIIMTDMVMIVALLPMVLSVSTGSELHKPLAVVYVGGFFFAIVLRLIVVPVLYEILGASSMKRKAKK